MKLQFQLIQTIKSIQQKMSIRVQKFLIMTAIMSISLCSHIHMLVNKLFDQVCTQDSKQTISLYECEPNIIQHDKKMNTYRNDEQYKMETFYMMTKYDGNKDKRLSRQETLAMAYDIADGVINQRVVRSFWKDYGPKNQDKLQKDSREDNKKLDQEEL